MIQLPHRFDHTPDKADKRDLSFDTIKSMLQKKTPPASMDLREPDDTFPPIYNQGSLNSCSANALAAVLYYDEVKQNLPNVSPSRLFVYYNTRKAEDVLNDPSYGSAGAPVSMRDAIKSTKQQGYCDEQLWPYDEANVDVPPSAEAYEGAIHHHSYRYHRIAQHLNNMKLCLCNGHPFVFGFLVYQGFLAPSTWETGIIPIPKEGQPQIGGHAMVAVGYDDGEQWFIVRNSLGENFGDKGYGYFPYEYALSSKNAFDFWVINRVQDN